MDLSTGFQKLMGTPTVQKLRAVEQRRMARLTVKKDSALKTLRKLDEIAKEAVAESLKTRAEDLRLQADDLLEQAEDILRDDEKKNLE